MIRADATMAPIGGGLAPAEVQAIAQASRLKSAGALQGALLRLVVNMRDEEAEVGDSRKANGHTTGPG